MGRYTGPVEKLREAQKLKIAYGIREKQMRRLVDRARRNRETTAGEALLQMLERRLDNVVFRLDLASTRRQACQFVGHGHVLVDGRRLDVPSALVRVLYEEPIEGPEGLRKATVKLAHRARAGLER